MSNLKLKTKKEERELVEKFMGWSRGVIPQYVDFNEVMSVVIKIEVTPVIDDNGNYGFQISENHVQVYENTPSNTPVFEMEGIEKIDIVWDSIVRFIKWYNEKKNNG